MEDDGPGGGGSRRGPWTPAIRVRRADDVLPELAALCEEHPLDEPLQALRLRALRDAGRTAQALAAYDEVRTVLADRLGTDPLHGTTHPTRDVFRVSPVRSGLAARPLPAATRSRR
ncbi:BTAD domain-containing putative transcriptional regulator [Streptomyces sp. OR43]|uniref:BTAD domain-containing putative transcriptional regulator n=1 Tax=Streptomyces sp. or43 TaxID=2478957 RepID=UPI0021CA7EA6|nr:BTAD domain-containing putative transcriptional regulator [Streptomyces sp. or43]